MFVDRVKIYAKAGDGGRGCVSFRREKFIPNGGPDGGNGGWGGNIILRVDSHTNHLIDLLYQSRLVAKHGGHGSGKKKQGRSAKDIIVKVPRGTIVRRLPEMELVADLVNVGDEITLCTGGRGGRGNYTFKNSVNQAPREFTEGAKGEEGEFQIEMKMVADVGIVGFPNAGKSTLISKLSHAHPKIAPYPFTTLSPIVGTIDFGFEGTLQITDVPGLVEGAHENVGLGHGFLRHIERCSHLLILIDMAGTDGRDPRKDYTQLLNELELYDASILEKPRILVANKMDQDTSGEWLKKFKRKVKGDVLPISAEKGDGLVDLKKILLEKVLRVKPRQAEDRTGSDRILTSRNDGPESRGWRPVKENEEGKN